MEIFAAIKNDNKSSDKDRLVLARLCKKCQMLYSVSHTCTQDSTSLSKMPIKVSHFLRLDAKIDSTNAPPVLNSPMRTYTPNQSRRVMLTNKFHLSNTDK